MLGNVTALVGLHVIGKYRTKHDAQMFQACGLGSSQRDRLESERERERKRIASCISSRFLRRERN